MAKCRSRVVKDHCTIAKTTNMGMNPGKNISVNLDLGLTEKPEPKAALGFKPAKTGRAEFEHWARERERSLRIIHLDLNLSLIGVILLRQGVCMSTASW